MLVRGSFKSFDSLISLFLKASLSRRWEYFSVSLLSIKQILMSWIPFYIQYFCSFTQDCKLTEVPWLPRYLSSRYLLVAWISMWLLQFWAGIFSKGVFYSTFIHFLVSKYFKIKNFFYICTIKPPIFNGSFGGKYYAEIMWIKPPKTEKSV